MTENSSPHPGVQLSGKDGEKDNQALGSAARRAKLTRKSAEKAETFDMTPDEAEKQESAAIPADETGSEDVYFDALLKFGIQI